MYHVLPYPTKIRNTELQLAFIPSEQSVLLIDIAKQYYVRLRVDEFKEHKLITDTEFANKITMCK